MRKINELRKEIDEIDDQLVKLLNRRFQIAMAVAIEKSKETREMYDSEREKSIIKGCIETLRSQEGFDDMPPRISEFNIEAAVEATFLEILRVSKNTQRQLVE